jgi:Holliday junction resolvase RusA-like endonuclease
VNEVVAWLDINPVPWRSPDFTAATGRGGKGRYVKAIPNQEVQNFQEAVREALRQLPADEFNTGLIAPPYELRFYLWRQLGNKESGSGRKSREHVADATNMQKALEDALQGVLIGNDRDVARISTTIVAQDVNTHGSIGIILSHFYEAEIPDKLVAVMNKPSVLSIGEDPIDELFEEDDVF